MKRYCIIFVFYCITFSFHAQDVYLWQVMKNRDIITWGKSVGDEFEKPKVDENKWAYNYVWGKDSVGTGDYPLKENVSIKNGRLEMLAKRENFRTRGVPWLPDTAILNDKTQNLRDWKYSSALLFSKQKYLYGIYECKFQTPPETGMWPAFWIYSGGPNHEIDMFEGKGERNTDLHIDIHNQMQPSWFGGWIRLKEPMHEKFASVRLQWDSSCILLSVNDNVVAHYFGKMNVPGHLISNNAISTRKNSNAKSGSFFYPINASTKFPNTMLLEYIRIWERPQSVISRSEKDLIKTNTLLLSDTSLSQIDEKINIRLRKKNKFKKYPIHPNLEIRLEILYEERSINIYTVGNKTERISLSILDSKGTERFAVPEVVEHKYQFASAYIGGNRFKVKIKLSNTELEQDIDFRKAED